MKIKFSYPYWGSEHLPFESFLKRLKEEGYSGVEMGVSNDKSIEDLRRLLKKYELKLIAQQVLHTPNLSVDQYKQKMESYLYHLASLNPVFINSHTGKDYFSLDENCEIFNLCQKISEKTGVKIIHETHRGRALFSTYTASRLFKELPNLRITADFSHWCCVSESLLQDQEAVISEAITRADYVHARVGYDQGPQVNHPAAPENNKAVDIHLNWWKEIVASARKDGKDEFWICTEFGPKPYLQSLPFVGMEVAEQFDVNLYIKFRIENVLRREDVTF